MRTFWGDLREFTSKYVWFWWHNLQNVSKTTKSMSGKIQGRHFIRTDRSITQYSSQFVSMPTVKCLSNVSVLTSLIPHPSGLGGYISKFTYPCCPPPLPPHMPANWSFGILSVTIGLRINEPIQYMAETECVLKLNMIVRPAPSFSFHPPRLLPA
jgi:hypothetical protein